MNFKLIIYILSVLFTTFAFSSIDFNRIFKQNKVVEANIFVVLLILGFSGLVARFIIDFMEVSKIL